MARGRKYPANDLGNQPSLSLCPAGFTLIEVIVVVGIIGFLIASISTFLTISNRSWGVGQDKLIEQQQARIAMDEIARLLRRSNPDWNLTNSSYPVTITNSSRIDFYVPIFGGTDNRNITSLRKVTFKQDETNSTLLVKKEGTSPSKVVAADISAISFNCACSGCTAVDSDCPFVAVNITTRKQGVYNLQSKIVLRNKDIAVPGGVSVEEPEEGEF